MACRRRHGDLHGARRGVPGRERELHGDRDARPAELQHADGRDVSGRHGRLELQPALERRQSHGHATHGVPQRRRRAGGEVLAERDVLRVRDRGRAGGQRPVEDLRRLRAVLLVLGRARRGRGRRRHRSRDRQGAECARQFQHLHVEPDAREHHHGRVVRQRIDVRADAAVERHPGR